jgi:hypothetical protein
MPFTLEQLDFLTLHVGVAIPPDFLENKRRAEDFKKRSAEMAARSEEIKQRRDAADLEAVLKQATTLAGAKDFAGALKSLDQLEATLAVPEAPELEAQPEPAKAEAAPQHDPSKDGVFVKLQKSRLQWHETRGKVHHELEALEQAIIADCKQINADPNEEFEFDLNELAAKAKHLYTIMDKMDERLIDKLDEALAAKAAARDEKQKEAAAIVKEYTAFLNGDPLIAVIDNSGFMNTSIKQTFAKTLTELAANL